MSSKELFTLYNYYQILNKTIIRNKAFHFLFNILDTLLSLLKILDVYKTHYNLFPNNSLKYINVVSYFSNYSKIIKLIPLIISSNRLFNWFILYFNKYYKKMQ